MIKYTEDHEWLNLAGGVAKVGVTRHAAEQLGNLVFVEVNEAVVNDPSLVNADPQGAGWLFSLRLARAADGESLLDEAPYLAHFG